MLCTQDEPGLIVLGSCFAFRTRTHFLTAAHCIHGLAAEHLRVLCPGSEVRPVEDVVRHPSADLAFLVVTAVDDDVLQPFAGHLRQVPPGVDVTLYGFPADVFGAEQGSPVPRVLRSHVQRLMAHRGRCINASLSTA